MEFSLERKLPLWDANLRAWKHCSWVIAKLLAIGIKEIILDEKQKEFNKCPDEKLNYFGSYFDSEGNTEIALKNYRELIDGHATSAWNYARMNENGIKRNRDIFTAVINYARAWKLYETHDEKTNCENAILNILNRCNHQRKEIYFILQKESAALYNKLTEKTILLDDTNLCPDVQYIDEIVRILNDVASRCSNPDYMLCHLGIVHNNETNSDQYSYSEKMIYETIAIRLYEKSFNNRCANAAWNLAILYKEKFLKNRFEEDGKLVCKWFAKAWELYEEYADEEVCAINIERMMSYFSDDGSRIGSLVDVSEREILDFQIREAYHARKLVEIGQHIENINKLTKEIVSSRDELDSMATRLGINFKIQLTRLDFILKQLNTQLENIFERHRQSRIMIKNCNAGGI
ncbi:MAG: hypothetical protein Harvfovirus15_14 [Harvfovirus sp.]|uniref:Tetratricopeptide repeat protein n=1 Tax=Harvfovirus sp. TaxID=2487768 RepID=A0A3G5A1R8_9VIRU|nr:MAG: hypothetical protein Harvfovirus15_14 [Harvfovirus sp.]